jgi:hypothetical protein
VRGTWQTTDSGGGGGPVLIVVIAVLALGSGAASAAASALVTLVIIAAAVITVAVLAAAGLLIWRTRSERPGRPVTARPIVQLPPSPVPRLEDSSKPAIGPAREIHLHLSLTPDQLAAIMRHHTEGG